MSHQFTCSVIWTINADDDMLVQREERFHAFGTMGTWTRFASFFAARKRQSVAIVTISAAIAEETTRIVLTLTFP